MKAKFYNPSPLSFFRDIALLFNKIAIQGTRQMTVDKEAISLSRVYSYDLILCVTRLN